MAGKAGVLWRQLNKILCVNTFAKPILERPFPLAISISILMHLGLVTWMTTGHQNLLHYSDNSNLQLRLTRLSKGEAVDKKSTDSPFIKDAKSVNLASTETSTSSLADYSSSLESETTEKSFDSAQFSFNDMPPMPLNATGKTGWGIGAFPDATERMPPEAQAAQQLQMRISKQRKLVLGYLDQAQEELASRQPPTFCVVKFDIGWQKSWVRCESAQDELLVNQFLMRGSVTHATTALPIETPCTHIGSKKPLPEFECQ